MPVVGDFVEVQDAYEPAVWAKVEVVKVRQATFDVKTPNQVSVERTRVCVYLKSKGWRRLRSTSDAPPAAGSVMLPPISQAELEAMLADVSFSRSTAKRNGNCLPLSAMAGFEISAKDAQQPSTDAAKKVREARSGAVGILTNNDAVDGIDAAVFRTGEKLPANASAARKAMKSWRKDRFWKSGNGNKFASFTLGVALHLERPIAVVERSGTSVLNPVRVYGARDASGALIHSIAKPNAPETVPTYKLKPLADLVEQLRAEPKSCSVIEFDGINHFDPWLVVKEVATKEAGAVAMKEVEEEVEKEVDEVVEDEDEEEKVNSPPGPRLAKRGDDLLAKAAAKMHDMDMAVAKARTGTFLEKKNTLDDGVDPEAADADDKYKNNINAARQYAQDLHSPCERAQSLKKAIDEVEAMRAGLKKAEAELEGLLSDYDDGPPTKKTKTTK